MLYNVLILHDADCRIYGENAGPSIAKRYQHGPTTISQRSYTYSKTMPQRAHYDLITCPNAIPNRCQHGPTTISHMSQHDSNTMPAWAHIELTLVPTRFQNDVNTVP